MAKSFKQQLLEFKKTHNTKDIAKEKERKIEISRRQKEDEIASKKDNYFVEMCGWINKRRENNEEILLISWGTWNQRVLSWGFTEMPKHDPDVWFTSPGMMMTREKLNDVIQFGMKKMDFTEEMCAAWLREATQRYEEYVELCEKKSHRIAAHCPDSVVEIEILTIEEGISHVQINCGWGPFAG